MKRRKLILRAAEAFDLPGELVAGASKVEIAAGKELRVTNHRGILEYGENEINVNLDEAVLRIRGTRLEMVAMTTTDICVRGGIFGVEYVYGGSGC